MRNWMKQVGMAFSLVVAVGGPSTALAYPPQCMDVCSCASSCAQPCYWGTFRTNCGEELCQGMCAGSAPQASVNEESQEVQQQGEEDVCTEPAPESASAEG